MTDGLPPGWASADIGSLGRYVNGRGFGKTEWRKSGLPIIRIQNLNDESATFNYSDKEHEEKYRVRDGDLLVAWAASLGVYVWKRGPAWLNQHIFRVEVEERVVTKAFLYYALRHALAALYKKAHGSGMVHVTKAKFESHPVNLPPINEQKRIVSKIDELFSRVDEGERALERASKVVERYRRSVLNAAVNGELTRDWRERSKNQSGHAVETGKALLARILKARREAWEQADLAKMQAKGIMPKNDAWKKKYKEPASPDITNLPILPDGWVWATVEQLSTKVVDGVHKKPSYVETGIPFVTVKNLTAGAGISFESLNYITPEDHAQFTKRTNPERGDVLVSKDGTLGVVRVINTDTVFSIFVSVALIKPVFRDMGDYLGLALASPIVQAQMVPKGSGLQHIHLADLRQDCLPICSAEEQRRISSTVAMQMATADHIEYDLIEQVKDANKLRQAILCAGFSGYLVSQDEKDEPASLLLKRIATERANTVIANRRPRKKHP